MRSSRRNLGLQPDIIAEDSEPDDSDARNSRAQSETVGNMDNEEEDVVEEETVVVVDKQASPSVDIDIKDSTFSKGSADSDSDEEETRPSQ